MRIALLCEEAAGSRVLDLLARGPHELVAVATSEGSPAWARATKLGLRPRPALEVRYTAFADALAACGTELLLNVHSLYIVPPAVLRVPRLGAYNLHPGPLPGYAGLNAPSWAIYNGEQSHAVTVHRMEPGIDTGAVVFSQAFSIGAADTGLSVALRCTQEGVRLVEKLLAADPSTLPHAEQDLSQRRYFGRGVPQGGRIDWTASARRIYDFVRACDYHPFTSPWGTPRARLGEDEAEVQKVALTGERCDAPPGTIRDNAVATADEWLRLITVRRRSGSAPTARSPEQRSAAA